MKTGGDARCEAKLPLDGVYEIELHDHLYKAQGTASFRLKIGSFSFAETTFPLAVQAGTKARVTGLLSNVAQPWEVDFPATLLRGETGLKLPADNASGPQPRMLVSNVPEFKDALPENTAVPFAVSAPGCSKTARSKRTSSK